MQRLKKYVSAPNLNILGLGPMAKNRTKYLPKKVQKKYPLNERLGLIQTLKRLIFIIAGVLGNLRKFPTRFNIKHVKTSLGKRIVAVLVFGGLIPQAKGMELTTLSNAANETQTTYWINTIEEKTLIITLDQKQSDYGKILKWDIQTLTDYYSEGILKEKTKTKEELQTLADVAWYRNLTHIICLFIYIVMIYITYLFETEGNDQNIAMKVHFINICAFVFVLLFLGGFIVTHQIGSEDFDAIDKTIKKNDLTWKTLFKRNQGEIKQSPIYMEMMNLSQYTWRVEMMILKNQLYNQTNRKYETYYNNLHTKKFDQERRIIYMIFEIIITLLLITITALIWFYIKSRNIIERNARNSLANFHAMIAFALLVMILPGSNAKHINFEMQYDTIKMDGIEMVTNGNTYVNSEAVIWISSHMRETKDNLDIKCPCYKELPDDPSLNAIYCAIEMTDCTNTHRLVKISGTPKRVRREVSFSTGTLGSTPTTENIIPTQVNLLWDHSEKTLMKTFNIARTNIAPIAILFLGWYLSNKPIFIMGLLILASQSISATSETEARTFCQWNDLMPEEATGRTSRVIREMIANNTFQIANQSKEVYYYYKTGQSFPEENLLKTINNETCLDQFNYGGKTYHDGTFVEHTGFYTRATPFCYFQTSWNYVNPLMMRYREANMLLKNVIYPDIFNRCVAAKMENKTTDTTSLREEINSLRMINTTQRISINNLTSENILCKNNNVQLEIEINKLKNKTLDCKAIDSVLKQSISEYFALQGHESLSEKMFKIHMKSASEEIVDTIVTREVTTKKLMIVLTMLTTIYFLYQKPAIIFIILITCAFGYVKSEDCVSLERSQLITGSEIANVYISIKSGQCQIVTTQEGAMFQVHVGYAVLTSGITHTAAYPRKGQWSIRSDSRCPGNGDSICECKGTQCVSKKSTIDRGWGNGCFLFGAGSVCTSATFTPSESANDWIYEYTIDQQNVVAKMIITDGTNHACYRRNSSIWQILPGRSTCNQPCVPRNNFTTVLDDRGIPPNHPGTRCYLGPGKTSRTWCATSQNTFCDCDVEECTNTRELASFNVGTDLATTKIDIRGFGIIESSCSVKTTQQTSMHYMYIFHHENVWDSILYPMSGHAIWSTAWSTDKRSELREIEKAISFHGLSTDGFSYNSHFPNIEQITKGERAKLNFIGSNINAPSNISIFETVQLNCRLSINPKIITKPPNPCLSTGLKMFKKSETTLTVSSNNECSTRIFGIGCTLLKTQITITKSEQDVSVSCEDTAGQVCIDAQCVYMRDPNPYHLYVKAPVMNILSTTLSWMKVGGGVNSLYGFGGVLSTKLHAAFSLAGITNSLTRLVAAVAFIYFAMICSNTKLKLVLFAIGSLLIIPTAFGKDLTPIDKTTQTTENYQTLYEKQKEVLEQIIIDKQNQENEFKKQIVEVMQNVKKYVKENQAKQEDQTTDDEEEDERTNNNDVWVPNPDPSRNAAPFDRSENPAKKIQEEANYYVFGIKSNDQGYNLGYYHLTGCTVRKSYSIGFDTQHKVEMENCPSEGFTGPMMHRGNKDSVLKVLGKMARSWYTGYIGKSVYWDEPKETYHHCINTASGPRCNHNFGSQKMMLQSKQQANKYEMAFHHSSKHHNQKHLAIGHSGGNGDNDNHHVSIFCVQDNDDLRSEINKALMKVFSTSWDKFELESRHISWKRGYEMTARIMHFSEYIDDRDSSAFERKVSRIFDDYRHKKTKKANRAQRKKAHEVFQGLISEFVKMFPKGVMESNTYLHYLSKYPHLLKEELTQICANLECSKYIETLMQVVAGSAGEIVFRMVNAVFQPQGNA